MLEHRNGELRLKENTMRHHIYHHNDMDGHASGAITAFGLERQGIRQEDILFYRITYGQPFDDSEIDYENDKVYVVDFALQPYDRMAELAELCNLTWIDHHITSINWFIEAYSDEEAPFAYVLEEGSKAACELCWEYFFDTPVPELIERISKYDIWDKNYSKFRWEEEQLPLQTHLRNIETRPAESMDWWRQQLTMGMTNLEVAKSMINTMTEKGRSLQEFDDKKMKRLTLGHAYEADLSGYKVYALNTTQGGSRQFEVAIDMNDYDMVCAFRLYKGEYWVINLYSVKENINCGALAKELGAEGPFKSGGGHPGAAGFQTSYEHLMSILKPIPKEGKQNE